MEELELGTLIDTTYFLGVVVGPNTMLVIDGYGSFQEGEIVRIEPLGKNDWAVGKNDRYSSYDYLVQRDWNDKVRVRDIPDPWDSIWDDEDLYEEEDPRWAYDPDDYT